MSKSGSMDLNSVNPPASKGGSTDELAADEEEIVERGHWGSGVEFVLSCLGYAVGLGNVWRFPYMCFTNGGGAFLIPYVIMLLFVGLPVFFIELSVGQFSAEGPMTVWSAVPLFQGVGAGMVVISFIGSIYYNMIIAWALYYMFAGFTNNLPWIGCTHDYNTARCYSKFEATECEKEKKAIWWNQTCYNSTYFAPYDIPSEFCNGTSPTPVPVTNLSTFTNALGQLCYNYTQNIERERIVNLTAQRRSASEEYFNFFMLERTETIEEGGKMKWELALVLLLAWILCFLCIIKGIRSSGKVVYFTATFPYLILVILFFRGVTLPGAGDGIYFYLVPSWEKLATPKVWVDAAGQIFFSLSVGMGGLMTFASYNKFHNNVFRDTLIVTFGNCLTSFFAGFVIFSILGFMARELGTEVGKVAQSGSGLAFIAYPEVVSRLPVAPLWSFLFFFMLLLLGLDSQFAGLENIQTAIVDMIPRLRRWKTIVAALLCVVMYILGFSMCMQSGIYWEELMSYYASGWSLVLIGMSECMVFAWIYGSRRLLEDIEMMIGRKPPPHQVWWVMWTIFTPLLLIGILIFNIYDTTPLAYGNYVLPPWAQALGWMMAVASVAMIPIFAVIRYVRSYSDDYYEGLSAGQRILKLLKPHPDWKPAIEKVRSTRVDPESGPKATTPYDQPPPYSVDNPGFQPQVETGL